MYKPVFDWSWGFFDFPPEDSCVKLFQFLYVFSWDFKVHYGVVHFAFSPPLRVCLQKEKEVTLVLVKKR